MIVSQSKAAFNICAIWEAPLPLNILLVIEFVAMKFASVIGEE